MASEFTPPPREAPFELSHQAQYDPTAPRRILDEEDRRVAGTLPYRLAYEAEHPYLPNPSEGPLDTDILHAIEQEVSAIMHRDASNKKPRLDQNERVFLALLLGLSKPKRASGKAIRETYYRRQEYLLTLRYADYYGLPIADAVNDMTTGRVTLLPGLFQNPKLLTELRRRIASGNDPEFTSEDDFP